MANLKATTVDGDLFVSGSVKLQETLSPLISLSKYNLSGTGHPTTSLAFMTVNLLDPGTELDITTLRFGLVSVGSSSYTTYKLYVWYDCGSTFFPLN